MTSTTTTTSATPPPLSPKRRRGAGGPNNNSSGGTGGGATVSTPDAQGRRAARYMRQGRRLVARCLLQLYRCVGWLLTARARAARPHLIDADVAQEIERVTDVLERYTAAERRYKLLDAARRYCRHCERHKAPREHHCSVCNQCVAKMDHHCPFINACVDAENQRYFFLMVLWLAVGTFLVNVFIGYGWARQRWYVHQLGKAATAAARAALYSPYDPNGSKLTGFPVCLTLAMTCVMFVCMCLFLYHNTRQVMGNVTSIEMAVVQDKQERVFASTSFTYITPYSLGSWRNMLECFRTLDDPFVHADLMRGEDDRRAAAAVLLSLMPPAASRSQARARLLVWRALVLVWLTALPTLRPTGCDGVHYPIFDTETKDLDGYCIDGEPPKQQPKPQPPSVVVAESATTQAEGGDSVPHEATSASATTEDLNATKEVMWL